MIGVAPIRILYINHTGKVSGAELVLLRLLQGLDRRTYQPMALCPTDGTLKKAIEQLGVPCAGIEALNARFTLKPNLLAKYVLSMFKSIAEMRRHIRAVGPDLIHANTVRAGIAATIASAGMKMPVVWHVHDILPRHVISTAIRTLAFVSKRTHAVGVSFATSAAFRGRLTFNKRISVVYNGIDFSRFPRKQAGDAPFKQELGLGAEDFLVCAVGQITQRKGLRDLLTAFCDVCQRSSSTIHLAIVGAPLFNRDEELYNDLIAATAKLGLTERVHFTGARSDVPAILRSADLLVLNSSQEPFALVILEGMSSGTPVVATAVGGVPELVTDGESGWLVPHSNPPRLAERILCVSRDRAARTRVVNFAIASVCPRFTLETFITNMHEYYATLLPQRTRPHERNGKEQLEVATGPYEEGPD